MSGGESGHVQWRCKGEEELTENSPVSGSKPTCTSCTKSRGAEMSTFRTAHARKEGGGWVGGEGKRKRKRKVRGACQQKRRWAAVVGKRIKKEGTRAWVCVCGCVVW